MKVKEINRDSIALSEYAPGNYVYYRGSSYQIDSARTAAVEQDLTLIKVLICPSCERVYLGNDAERARHVRLWGGFEPNPS